MFTIQVSLTNQCNLGCRYCWVDQTKSTQMTLDIFKQQWFFLKNKLSKVLPIDEEIRILFFGGEPLLKIDLIEEICKFLSNDEKINFSISTNGILLTQEIRNKLNELNIKTQISFDGIWNKTNRIFKNGNETFDLYSDIIQEKDFIRMVISKDCLNSLEENINYMYSISNNFTFGFSYSGWDESSVKLFDTISNSFFDLMIDHFKQGKNLPKNIKMDIRRLFDLTQQQIYPSYCQAGIKRVSFHPDGLIYPCSKFADDNKHLWFANSNNDEINYDTIKQYQEKYTQIRTSCEVCPINKICYIGCLSEIHKAGWLNKTTCELYKVYFRNIIRIFLLNKNDEKFKTYIFGK